MLDPKSQLLEEHMFVAIARFPEIPFERGAEFRAWFAWSNGQLRGADGLRSRQLLRAEDGSYSALVEHDNADTYAAMHSTAVASRVHARLAEVLEHGPSATNYEVVVDLAWFGSCSGARGGHAGQGTRDEVSAGVSDDGRVDLQPPTMCTTNPRL
jgi:heme-degrading monooxygenase HmoA